MKHLGRYTKAQISNLGKKYIWLKWNTPSCSILNLEPLKQIFRKIKSWLCRVRNGACPQPGAITQVCKSSIERNHLVCKTLVERNPIVCKILVERNHSSMQVLCRAQLIGVQDPRRAQSLVEKHLYKFLFSKVFTYHFSEKRASFKV